MIEAISPYQPNKDKTCYFFEGDLLDKPGKAQPSLSATKKRASALTKAIKGLYLGKFNKKVPNLQAAKASIARQMRRPLWWFTVLVSERLRGKSLPVSTQRYNTLRKTRLRSLYPRGCRS